MGYRDQDLLDEYEAISFAVRSMHPLPPGRLSVTHYRAIHRHLFGDVYRWAGRFRTIRISKPKATFCYPEFIPAQMAQLFHQLRLDKHLQGFDSDQFATKAATFLAWLNQIHPFREGNGRAQMTFMALLSFRAGHPLDLARLDEVAFLNAMVQSFHGDEHPLRDQLRALIA